MWGAWESSTVKPEPASDAGLRLSQGEAGTAGVGATSGHETVEWATPAHSPPSDNGQHQILEAKRQFQPNSDDLGYSVPLATMLCFLTSYLNFPPGGNSLPGSPSTPTSFPSTPSRYEAYTSAFWSPLWRLTCHLPQCLTFCRSPGWVIVFEQLVSTSPLISLLPNTPKSLCLGWKSVRLDRGLERASPNPAAIANNKTIMTMIMTY